MSLSPCFQASPFANTDGHSNPSCIDVASTYGVRVVSQQTQQKSYAVPDAERIVRTPTETHACTVTELDDAAYTEYAAPGKRVIAVFGSRKVHYIMYASASSLHCCICGADFESLSDGMDHYGVSTPVCSAVELKLSGEGASGKVVMVAYTPPKTQKRRQSPFQTYLKESTAASEARFDLLPQVQPQALTRHLRRAGKKRDENKAKIVSIVKQKLAPQYKKREISTEQFKTLARKITGDAFDGDPDGDPEAAAIRAWTNHCAALAPCTQRASRQPAP